MPEYISQREFEGLKQHMEDIVAPIGKSVDGIDKHLEKLNGKVGKNTAFRNKITGGFILISALGGINLVGIIVVALKIFTSN